MAGRLVIKDISVLKKDIKKAVKEEVLSDMKAMEEEIVADTKSLKSDLHTDLNADMKELEEDLKDLKSDLNADMKGLKSDLKGLKSDLKVAKAQTNNFRIDLNTIDLLLSNKTANIYKLHVTQNNGELRGDEADPTPYYVIFEVNKKLYLQTNPNNNYASRIVEIYSTKNNEYSYRLDLITVENNGYSKNTMYDCASTECDRLNHYIKKYKMLEIEKQDTPLLLARNLAKDQKTLKDFESKLPPRSPNNLKNSTEENFGPNFRTSHRPKNEAKLDMFENEQDQADSLSKNLFASDKNPNEIYSNNLRISDADTFGANPIISPDDTGVDTNATPYQTPDLDEDSTDFVPFVANDEPDTATEDQDQNTMPMQNQNIALQNQNIAPEPDADIEDEEPAVEAEEPKTSDAEEQKDEEEEKKKNANQPLITKRKRKKIPATNYNLWKDVFKDIVQDVLLQYGPLIMIILCCAGVFTPFFAGWIVFGAIVAFGLKGVIVDTLEKWGKGIAGLVGKMKMARMLRKQNKKLKTMKKQSLNNQNALKQNTANPVPNQNKNAKTHRRPFSRSFKNKKIRGIEIDYSPADVAEAPYAKYGKNPYTPIKDKGLGVDLSEEEIMKLGGSLDPLGVKKAKQAEMARQAEIINSYDLDAPLMPSNVLKKSKIREEGIDYGTPNYKLGVEKARQAEINYEDPLMPLNVVNKANTKEEGVDYGLTDFKSDTLEEQSENAQQDLTEEEIRQTARELHYGQELPLDQRNKLYGKGIVFKDNETSKLPPNPPSQSNEPEQCR